MPRLLTTWLLAACLPLLPIPLTGPAQAARALPRPPHPPRMHAPAPRPAPAVFGPFMRQALLGFQRAYELPETGVADEATCQALERPFRGVLRQGMRGPAIAALQAALAQKAFWPEPATPVDVAIAEVKALAARPRLTRRRPVAPPLPAGTRLDGVFGACTARAVCAFQRHAGLAATGVADAPTLLALGLRGDALKRGDVGRRVTGLQRSLAERGFWAE